MLNIGRGGPRGFTVGGVRRTKIPTARPEIPTTNIKHVMQKILRFLSREY